MGEFADELARAVRDDQRAMTGLIALAYVDVAGDDDDEAGPDFSSGEELLARREGATCAEPAHALDLQWIEIGEHLFAPPFDKRLW